MSALDQLESFLQGLLERPAGMLMPKGLRPVQLASAITRELERKALRLADRIVIPSDYVISVSPDDYDRIGDVRLTLERELCDYVERVAAERELSLPADPEVQIRPDRGVSTGRTRVAASFAREQGTAAPRAIVDGLKREENVRVPREHGNAAAGAMLALLGASGHAIRRYQLDKPLMTLGRRSSNDIPLPDLNISRHHARFELSGGAWYLCDLESSNGTRVNGQDVGKRSRLRPGDIIEVGLQRLRFDTEYDGMGHRT